MELLRRRKRLCVLNGTTKRDRRNLLKHGFRFETATLVFDDLHALTQRDESASEEERWITLGSVSPGTVLFVVHKSSERGNEEVIRIISARAATPRERRAYEEAKQGTKTRHRRSCGNQRRRYRPH
ncbi:conserved hypothetical protein [Candidatus Sulfotelmatobacter kueseliae]|uniref:BrnT family toxin n=1 Tax=Candidatus Sulfotelmatobacter kueseliae TaxID=2042962 RepID=A0A2U3KDY0_9BACT|nr:conserved hypothetical protein [Candidatus Sulfotelmatobacter kueseliae]